ncbi:drug/metabolite exporter YedA [Nibrella saemangeumensis]|uniref:Drug/metabolite exporter YedA n=1 Tax=Nibrella saemangeumensis TaxID=1084526 RepID=A0ABP8N1A1_9BACT
MQSLTTPVATPNHRVTLILALTSVYILWGSTYLFIHFMTERMPPLYMASMRFLAAGSILYLYGRMTGSPMPTRKQWMAAGTIGILLLGIANGCLTIALQYIPTGIAALLAGMLPVFLLSLNWLSFNKVRPSNLAIAGLLLGLVGVYFLIKPDKLHNAGGMQANLIGAGLITIGNLAWAVGTLLSGRLSLPGQVISSGMQMLVGGLGLLTVSMLTEPVTLFTLVQAPPKALGSMLYLVVFGSIIGFSSYAWLARNAPPQLVATYAYVNPVVALLLGSLFAGETITGQSLIGAAIIISGVVLITLGRK